MIALINASPLIYLGKIGAINLLPQLFLKCITTKQVRLEAERCSRIYHIRRELYEVVNHRRIVQ